MVNQLLSLGAEVAAQSIDLAKLVAEEAYAYYTGYLTEKILEKICR